MKKLYMSIFSQNSLLHPEVITASPKGKPPGWW